MKMAMVASLAQSQKKPTLFRGNTDSKMTIAPSLTESPKKLKAANQELARRLRHLESKLDFSVSEAVQQAHAQLV